MTYFMIVFDRGMRKILDLEAFENSEEALEARLSREIESPGSALEIVVLGAEDENALRRTHSRYFGDVQEFASA